MNTEAINLTTDADLDRALADAAQAPARITAESAEYDARLDVVILRLSDSSRLVIARENLQGLENAEPAQLAHIEIHAGVDIAWPDLDVDHYLPHLLEGRYSTEKWNRDRMAAALAARSAA